MDGLDLNDVGVFVRVVDLGAFAKVARELGVPTSTVSRAVARLEERLGAALVRRASRNVQPTPAGRAFYDDVAPAVATLRSAARTVEGEDRAPRGKLRITAPNDAGAVLLPECVVAFTQRYPRVQVELVLTARRVNLIEEGFDLALRAGPLADSSLVARRLGQMEAALYASPSYLATRGTPTTLDDLDAHECVLFRPKDGSAEWTLSGPEGEVTKRVHGRAGADDFLFVREAAALGGGIALLPALMAASEVASGRLRRVLSSYCMVGAPFHLVHPPAKRVPLRVTAFRELLIERLERLRADAGLSTK